uniref:Uncharacterized protein n=1 Tax=Rhizophora mucronata TaxID=61149 RepID=A0A2P2J8A9_RHIMU
MNMHTKSSFTIKLNY